MNLHPDDIRAEHDLGDSLTSEVIAALVHAGIDIAAICRRVERGTLNPPRLDRVVYLSETAFEFARYDDGRDCGAMTFVVNNHIGNPIDIAAWSPRGANFASWLGRGALLGAENLFKPRLAEGLAVHASPLEWLRAACRGVMVIDPERARSLLYRAQPLEVASVAHGRELRRAMEVKPPQIFVSSNWRAAA
jgi:hypothetical protein